ncbi:TPA: hypothetical protein EYP66_07895 [Candidatus Poribacteria bacterium]|nr:hypothetical protein [Candidatus Poribacteria bacterium]
MNKQSLPVKKHSPVTIRAILVGLLLIPINSYWHIQMTLVWLMNFPAILTLLFNVIFILFSLVVINYPLKKYFPQIAFHQGELLTIYIMLCAATALNGYDMMQCLVSLIGTGTWYATPENEWTELFGHYLPNWLVIKDREILMPFYEGETSLYVTKYIRGWALPIASWTLFVMALIFVMVCINVLLRRQWIENERLAYPIAELPFDMTVEDNSRFFSNRALWIGIAVAGGTSLLNGFSYLYPTVPRIPIWVTSLNRYFTSKPWNAIYSMNITLYPFVIGLGFLMPLDLVFSYWAFYLFWQAQRVMGSYAGIASLPGFPYPMAQVRGVWIGLLLFALWAGRKHFARVFKQAFTGRAIDDSNEPMAYRNALIGIVFGMAFILGFCYLAGFSLWMALLFFFIYFALSTAITRIRAELGPPAHDMYGAGPDYILTTLLGARRIGQRNLTVMTLFYWINRESYRAHPMPHQLEGFKLADRVGMGGSRVIAAILLATLIGALSCFWAFLHAGYKIGTEARLYRTTWFAREGYNILASRITHPTGVEYNDLLFMGIGFIFTVTILLIRTRFLWWPLHPVGYAVTGWWIIGRLWFPLLISSIVKWAALKLGGVRAYRRMMPFFLGLILGDFVVGSLWSILGIALGRHTYVFWGG